MTEQPTLAELDRLAEPLHARVVTKEAMETMTRLAYEKGLADATHAALAALPPSAPPALDPERLAALIKMHKHLPVQNQAEHIAAEYARPEPKR